MKGKKLLSFVLMSGMTLSLLTGCGSSNNSTSGDAATNANENVSGENQQAAEGEVKTGGVIKIGASGENTKFGYTPEMSGNLSIPYLNCAYESLLNYDADGNCLGYAQERYLDTMDGDREPFLVFLDIDGEEMDYCSSKGGTILFDWDGSPVGKGYMGVDGLGFFRQVYTNIYRTTFYTDPEAHLTVDFMDRMAMFKKLQSDYRMIDSEPAFPVFGIIGTIALGIWLILEIGWRIDKWKEKKQGHTSDSSDPADHNDTGEE